MPKTSKSGRRKQRQSRPLGQGQPAPSTETTTTAPSKPLYRSREMSNRARVISLVVGDTFCFLIFVSLGSNVHGKGVDVLNSIWLAIPFLAAWFLVSPFIGAFRADIATRPKKMLIRTVFSWLATWPVAMAFRWLQIERVNPVPASAFLSFALVVLAFNLCLLLLWRWPFALNNDLRKRGV